MQTTHHVTPHTALTTEDMDQSRLSIMLEAKSSTTVTMATDVMELCGVCAGIAKSLTGLIQLQSANVSCCISMLKVLYRYYYNYMQLSNVLTCTIQHMAVSTWLDTFKTQSHVTPVTQDTGWLGMSSEGAPMGNGPAGHQSVEVCVLHQTIVCKVCNITSFTSEIIARCPYRGDPPYGSIKATGYTPGSTVHYICKKGFELDGEAWQKCLYTGYWSGEEPVCRSMCSIHTSHVLSVTISFSFLNRNCPMPWSWWPPIRQCERDWQHPWIYCSVWVWWRIWSGWKSVPRVPQQWILEWRRTSVQEYVDWIYI